MATYKHLRSSTANKRPTTSIADGQLAINTNTASPGLFFKDSAGTGIVKVGPVHVGTTAPNSTPAGSSGNYLGEQWLDTSVSPAQMKVWNGSAWVGVVADELPVSKLQDGAAGQIVQTDSAGTGVEWSSTANLPLGSASAPAYCFQGDTNTGIYSPGADQIAVSTGGSERARIDSSGRLGVGTSSPLSNLHVNSTGDTVARISSSFLNSTTTGLRIDTTGDSSAGQLYFEKAGVARGGLAYTHNALATSEQLGFRVAGGTDKLTITGAGNVSIAGAPQVTSIGSSNTLTFVGGASAARIYSAVSAGGEHIFANTATGVITIFRSGVANVGSIAVSASATAYNTSSDYRLKENVTPVTDGITRLQQLKPSRFNFIADPTKTVDGFLAHEVQTVVPEAITGEKDAVDDEGNPEYQGIDQSKLVPLLTAALQEAVAKIETLEARLTAAGF